MDTRVAVVSLWAEDVSALAHFYQEVIGLHLASHQHQRPHYKLGNCYLTILKGRSVPPQNAVPEHFPLIALAVGDLDAAIQRLQTHAIEMPWGIQRDSDSRWVMFYDPAGNLIELVEFKQSSN